MRARHFSGQPSPSSSGGTGGGSTPRRSITLEWITPAAPSSGNVHANVRGDEASNDFPGPFTQPDYARSLRVTFGGTWDGGDVTITGTDLFGDAVSETFVHPGNPWEDPVDGEKIFATVLTVTKELVGTDADGANVASVGTGTRLAINDPDIPADATLLGYALCYRDAGGSVEAKAIDPTYRSINFGYDLNGMNNVYAIVDVTP